MLAEHFAAEANAKIGGGVDVRASPKSMAKLLRQCKRTKEILSANNEAPISVESIHGEIDFRSSITRGTKCAMRCDAPCAAIRSVHLRCGDDETFKSNAEAAPQGAALWRPHTRAF